MTAANDTDTTGTGAAGGFTLAGVFEAVAEAVADREAIVAGDRCLTYGDLLERSRRQASYLHGRGLIPPRCGGSWSPRACRC